MHIYGSNSARVCVRKSGVQNVLEEEVCDVSRNDHLVPGTIPTALKTAQTSTHRETLKTTYGKVEQIDSRMNEFIYIYFVVQNLLCELLFNKKGYFCALQHKISGMSTHTHTILFH